jgi:salicylate hydroxylase
MNPSRIPQPSYPTRCLEFLSNVDHKELVEEDVAPRTNGAVAVQQAAVPLKVIVVGAGLGGLATAIALVRRGHSVTVLEQAPELGEVNTSNPAARGCAYLILKVGAGIQIPPNSSRLLLGWGLDKFLGNKVVEPEGMSFLRWQDGRKIAYTKLVPEFHQNFKAPYYVVHRAHFHDAMHKLALNLGVTVCVDSKVDTYFADKATVQLANGKEYTGDLVVAADGKFFFSISKTGPG